VIGAVAVPTSGYLLSGRIRAGSLSSVGASDDSRLELEGINGVVTWYGIVPNVTQRPSALRVVHEGSSNVACSQSLWLWSWTRGLWVQIDARTTSANDAVTDVAVPGDRTEFVGSTSKVGVFVACVGPSGLVTRTDRLVVSHVP
jgi:hypothetical protein